jgi:hypothetical protein
VTQTPAGWFPDPQTPGQLRYWDGAAWTAHTQPGGVGVAQPNAEGAVTSLVLGIVSIVGSCTFVTGIPAMVIGRRAIRAVDESGGRLGGKGLAQAGFWTGLVGTVLGVLAVAAVIAVFAIGSAFEDDIRDELDQLDENCRVINDDGTSSPC